MFDFKYSIPEIFTKINNEKTTHQPFGRFDRLNALQEKVKHGGALRSAASYIEKITF